MNCIIGFVFIVLATVAAFGVLLLISVIFDLLEGLL